MSATTRALRVRGPDPALENAYRTCKGVLARHGRSFFRATGLLPGRCRPHVWALYAYARLTDDIVDQPDTPIDTRAAVLAGWSKETLACLDRPEPPHPLDRPVLAALWHTSAALRLPRAHLTDFLDAMSQDLTVTGYDTWEDLRGYMHGSAAVIGELMAVVLGAPPDASDAAGALGEAFQLTNFLRDVADDLRLGRVYLPRQDLARFGVSAQDLAGCARAGRVTPAVRELLRLEAGRAHRLYRLAQPGIDRLPWDTRPAIRCARELYGGILLQIERADFNVFAARTVLPRSRRATAVLRGLSAGSTSRW